MKKKENIKTILERVREQRKVERKYRKAMMKKSLNPEKNKTHKPEMNAVLTVLKSKLHLIDAMITLRSKQSAHLIAQKELVNTQLARLK